MQFYRIIFRNKRDIARIEGIESGLKKFNCPIERNFAWHPVETVRVILRNVGKKYGETLLDGHYDYYIISETILSFFEKHGFLTTNETFPVEIIDPLPTRYQNVKQPKYFIIDYRKIQGALLDFKRFPYPWPRYCFWCKSLKFNDSKFMEDIIKQQVKPMYIDEKSWNGRHLFSIGKSQILDSPRLYCTELFKEKFETEFEGYITFEKFA
ncbi:MAG: hypothetical protein GY754_46515 [bacterium]|nr:hypothetical protein [bacterium]